MANTSVKDSRVSRGIALYREQGDEIVRYISGTFGVPSKSIEDFFYHVDLDAEPGERCQCRDHEIRKTFCIHQVAATIKAAKPTTAALRGARAAA